MRIPVERDFLYVDVPFLVMALLLLHMRNLALTRRLDAAKYGFGGARNESSTFMKVNLPAPVLNITSFDISDTGLYGYNLTTYFYPRSWVFDNQTYNSQYIAEKGACQTLSGSYKWGFSFFQLYIMIGLVLVWTLGIYLMWLQSHLTMKKSGRQEVAGEQKAILELAESMKRDLMENGHDPTTMTEAQVNSAVNDTLKGGSINYQLPLIPEGFSLRKGLMGWLNKEKWWTLAIMSLILILCTVWVVDPFATMWLSGPTATLIVALQVGSTTGSRVVLLTIFWVLWIVIYAPMTTMYEY